MLELTDTPLILIDVDKAEQNCRKMAAGLMANNISWRPHIKTHKSIYFAKKQQEWGARGISCSSVGEAAVMAEGGLDDIYIAYPVMGDVKARRCAELATRVSRLACLVNSLEAAEDLDRAFLAGGLSLDVMVEIDGRMGRGGIPLSELPRFVAEIQKLPALNIRGAASFCGKAGSLPDENARREDARIEAKNLVAAGEILRSAGIEAPVLSGGSSVSSRYPECLAGISESRAGTCIFNDMMHVSMGTCKLEDCAAVVRTSVVTIPYEGRFILDAGSKALSTDLCRHKGYGYIKELGEAALIEALNEEHGMCNISGAEVRLGQILSVIPNHICTAINLCDKVVCVKDGEYFELPVDARGVSK